MPGHVKPHKKSEHHALKLARFQLMAKAQLLNLGIAIRERREELGLSRNHLAQRFPVDPKTIERWEAGKNSGGFDNLDEVAKHLETTPQALQARAIAIARSNDSGATETQAEDRPATVTVGVGHLKVREHAKQPAQQPPKRQISTNAQPLGPLKQANPPRRTGND